MHPEAVANRLLRAIEQKDENLGGNVSALAEIASKYDMKYVANELLRIASTGDRLRRSVVLDHIPAIYKLAPEQTVEVLLNAAKDDDGWVRGAAVIAMRKIAFMFQRGDLLEAAIEALEQRREILSLLSFIDEGYTRFGGSGIPTGSKGKVAQVVRRALRDKNKYQRELALRVASLAGICDEVIEQTALDLVAQLSGGAIEASYRLEIHKRHPELFLNLDVHQIDDAYLQEYVRILCDLTETHGDIAWEKIAKIIRKKPKHSGWAMIAVAEKTAGEDDRFWELLWETIDNSPPFPDWWLPLVETMTQLADKSQSVAERVLAALGQGKERSKFVVDVIKRQFSIALNE